MSIVVSPSWHQLYRFNFPDDTDEVIIQVNSPDTTCMAAAVQSPSVSFTSMPRKWLISCTMCWTHSMTKPIYVTFQCELLSGPSTSLRHNHTSFKSLWQAMTSVAVIPVKVCLLWSASSSNQGRYSNQNFSVEI